MKTYLSLILIALSATGTVLAQTSTNLSTVQADIPAKMPLVKAAEVTLTATNDFLTNNGGTRNSTAGVAAYEMYLALDLQRVSNISGEFMAHFVSIQGTDPSTRIGDSQVASNIAMPGEVNRVTDLWYMHKWNDNSHTLFGIHDISSEFYITESSLGFMNSSFGTGSEFASSGQAGPSMYPITSDGIRQHFEFDNNIWLKAGVYDADPSDHRAYSKSRGSLFITELAYQTENKKISLGAWNYTKHFSKHDSQAEEISWGLYSLAEEKINDNMSVFARLGWANPNVNIFQQNLALGTTYRALFLPKMDDEIGLGMSRVDFSSAYRNALLVNDNFKTFSHETAYELYYQFSPFGEIFRLRPDIQFIRHPSGATNTPDAWVFGLRTLITI
ncbi:MAG: carbohydrate porin [Bacteriovoracaceae bacterium]|nr:carbohydrate porin [Bacteriovoracaceae bacterium]